MTPRFRVRCKATSQGWLGSVELDEGKYMTAAGTSKESLLEELQRTVIRRTALSRGSFELFEGTTERPRSRSSVAPRLARSSNAPAAAWRGSIRPNHRSQTAQIGWFETLLPALFRD